jgi:hypothetical protein
MSSAFVAGLGVLRWIQGSVQGLPCFYFQFYYHVTSEGIIFQLYALSQAVVITYAHINTYIPEYPLFYVAVIGVLFSYRGRGLQEEGSFLRVFSKRLAVGPCSLADMSLCPGCRIRR